MSDLKVVEPPNENPAVETAIANAVRNQGDYEIAGDILQTLMAVKDISGCYVSQWSKVICVEPRAGVDVRSVAMGCLRAQRLAAKGAIPLRSLAEKKFDEYTGKIKYKIESQFEGWTIEVSGGEPRCEIVKVTTDEEVPAREAYTHTVERYKLKDPAACGQEAAKSPPNS